VAFEPGVVPPAQEPERAHRFGFARDRLLVELDGERALLAAAADGEAIYLGTLDGVACFAVELGDAEPEPAPGLALEGLRALHSRLDDALWSVAGRAFKILEWDRTHRFCGRCGTPTERHATERARACPACGLHAYPRLAPAVITIVERGDEILLARNASFPLPFYSTIAGFVEPGESLEEAVVREIREEVGVAVRDVAYFGSQPWPFPNSLMIGFTATWAGGEIRIDETELADAGWFRKDELPLVPPPLSIARALIDWAVARR
jgi:NAD+ diphosphatase